MTVERVESTVCAGWTYLDERGETCWKVVLRDGEGKWTEVDESGVSYDQTATTLRTFINDWIASVRDEPEGMPSDDTIEVYRQAAEFIESQS